MNKISEKCKSCIARPEDCLECPEQKRIDAQKRRNLARRERDAAMRSLGLVKVRGSVSGKTYWE